MLDEPTRKSLLELPHGPQLFQRLQSTPSDPSTFLLSQLGLLLSGAIKISVPVYTIYGPVEDVRVLEKFRTGEYAVPNGNLKILDEAMTYALEAGGVKLRLLGLGGGIIMHKMFDNGEGDGTIAGGNGTVWATALQIGELVDTAKRVSLCTLLVPFFSFFFFSFFPLFPSPTTEKDLSRLAFQG